jgi:RimJ/RimL family protein N-acetyltransferase
MTVDPSQAFRTPRLSLRLVREDDRGDLIALERDPEVMRFLNGGRPTPEDGLDPQADFLMPRGGEPGIWAAFEIVTDAFVGWFSLRPRGEHVAELGYRLRRSAWGRGFGSEGARALVQKGFAEMHLDRIFATTMAVNHASRRVMEKAGLTYVRTVYRDWPDALPDSQLGEVEYELTRAVWQRSGEMGSE